MPDDADSYPFKGEETGNFRYYDPIPQDKDVKWRIMNIDSKGVDLISERGVPRTRSFGFNGSLGFNNCVYILNDICKKQYSNEYLGATGRSINLLDIEKNFSSSGVTKRNSYETPSTKIKYGESKTYYNCMSPDIYDYVEQTSEGESRDYYTSPTSKTCSEKTSISVKQTKFVIDNLYTEDFKEPKFLNTILRLSGKLFSSE